MEGRRAAVCTTAGDVASPERFSLQRKEMRLGGDTTGGGYTSVLSVLCHGGARASMRWRWAGWVKLQPM